MGKVAVSVDYVQEQRERDITWLGASDVAAATALLDPVTSDPSSVLIGVRNAEELTERTPDRQCNLADPGNSRGRCRPCRCQTWARSGVSVPSMAHGGAAAIRNRLRARWRPRVGGLASGRALKHMQHFSGFAQF